MAACLGLSAAAAAGNAGEIYRLGLNGQRTDLSRSPSRDIDPVVSPSGQEVAFVSVRMGGAAVYVVGIDGRDLRRVSGPLDQPHILSWSPNGSHVLVVTSAGLFALTPGAPPLLAASGGPCGPVPASWSPESRSVAFIPCQADTTLQLASPFEHRIRSLTVGHSIGFPITATFAWSEGGELAVQGSGPPSAADTSPAVAAVEFVGDESIVYQTSC